MNTQPKDNLMDTASLALGIVSIVLCFIIYFSIPAGAIAVILSTLSRGDKMKYSTKASFGMWLGIIGISLTILIYIAAYLIVYLSFGSIDSFMDAYYHSIGQR